MRLKCSFWTICPEVGSETRNDERVVTIGSGSFAFLSKQIPDFLFCTR